MSQIVHDSAGPSSAVAPSAARQTLDMIVSAALAAVPGFSYAGISIVYRDGWVETVAGTDRLVWEIDALQIALGDGPFLGALHEDMVVVASDLAFDPRWPQYGVKAAERTGLKSQLALQIYVDDDTLCALSLYSTKNIVIHPDAPQLAERFANHAATAMGRPALFDHLSSRRAERGTHPLVRRERPQEG